LRAARQAPYKSEPRLRKGSAGGGRGWPGGILCIIDAPGEVKWNAADVAITAVKVKRLHAAF
jgi:hypothetical protein